jgi:guanylate kinase
MPAGRLPKGNGKAIIFSAPSGAGKSTMVKNLMELTHLSLGFSVSATTRARRGSYFYISPSQFDTHVDKNDFVEWEEVYPGLKYGTLCSEVEKLWSQGLTPVFDVDVVGGQTLKSVFQDSALLIFVMPPSVDELERRLRFRATEDEESIQKRLRKASRELETAHAFDVRLINDDLEKAISETSRIVTEFLAP